MGTSTQWQLAREAAERYEQILVPAILGPAAQALVEWATLRDGEKVLDVGCGTGAAARFAAEQVGASGQVLGIDVNAGMLAVAKTLRFAAGTAVEWQEQSAYRLPLSDETVDVALCAQTLQFLSDRHLALAEMYRVLKPGGRIALSLWCDIRESPYFCVLVDAISKHIGQATAVGLKAAFGLSDATKIRTLLVATRFTKIEMTAKQFNLELPPVHDFVPRHISATPMAAGFDAASRMAQQMVLQDVAEQLAAYRTDAGMRIPFTTHLARATK